MLARHSGNLRWTGDLYQLVFLLSFISICRFHDVAHFANLKTKALLLTYVTYLSSDNCGVYTIIPDHNIVDLAHYEWLVSMELFTYLKRIARKHTPYINLLVEPIGMIYVKYDPSSRQSAKPHTDDAPLLLQVICLVNQSLENLTTSLAISTTITRAH